MAKDSSLDFADPLMNQEALPQVSLSSIAGNGRAVMVRTIQTMVQSTKKSLDNEFAIATIRQTVIRSTARVLEPGRTSETPIVFLAVARAR
ncbi:hypothetical protein AbraIFM66951_011148 [Aspergillus brasiliensis]|uniref:Uncharacterized protein n=1 Tax=Aspergillus brasiliensis TaxID=319629 RepID=A0A9W5YV26_9EURO|nr:hypothetical protein AbraCBS73388_011136 [Aspergillus brasiliensis]GKZ47591.1 hypothetical protein AbraIFM66951_011148 [Aspergillus brasiliensis]